MITTRRPNRLWAGVLAGLALALVAGYQWVQAQLAEPEVRNFVEAKAREILKADIKIGKIRYLPPAQVSLQEIQMAGSEAHPNFSIVQIKKLQLGFSLLNLIRRDFNVPASVVMDSPRILFAPRSFDTFLSDSTYSFSKTVPTTLRIQGGEFRIPWNETGKEWVLRNVQFQAKPDLRGQIRLRLASEISGVAEGRVEVKGWADPQFHRYELEVRLREVTFLPESGLPLKRVNGKFYLTEKLIQVTGLTSFFHDWEIQWKGKIEDWQAQPKVFFDLTHKRGKSPFRLSLQVDFESEKISGEASWISRSYPFRGKVVRQGKKILFPSLEFPEGYTGEGEINGSSGDYRLALHQDRRRFQVHSNFNQLEFQTEFQLDHALVNHLDWVVRGKAHLVPMPKEAGEESSRFKGSVKTDYLVVEYEPLQDFQGSFELSSEGIQAMDFSWGRVFHLGGRILFKGSTPREDLLFRVDGFPLESARDFGRRPLPENLRGELEGKLKLRGELSRPEIQGYFTIKEGTIQDLDFDRAILQFQGYPPYLKLYDSKIFKGRNTLKMVGAINLKLKNLFHGIQIKGSDSLVIWKGVSTFWKKGELAIQAEKPLNRKLTMDLEVGTGSPDSQGNDRDEAHAVLGPKMRF